MENTAPDLRIWPVLGLAAIKSRHVGGWRAWTIARYLDTNGSGRIERKELNRFLNSMGLEPRTRRRWISDALEIGLLVQSRSETFYMLGLTRAARLFDVSKIGKPALIHTSALVRKGWRSHVFEAFNATLPGPMSQRVKQVVTRITPRTQRNYLRLGLGYSRSNYARRPEPADHADGLREVRGLAVFTKKGELIQRCPDQRIVPASVATRAHKGRSRKIQKQLNDSSCILARGNRQGCFELFCETEKRALESVREIQRSELTHRPREVFAKVRAGETSTTWRVYDATSSF